MQKSYFAQSLPATNWLGSYPYPFRDRAAYMLDHYHGANQPPPQTSPLGAWLMRWAGQPISYANRRTIVWTGVIMMLMLFASRRDAGQVAFARQLAIICFSVNAFLHVALLRGLRFLRDKGTPEAIVALRVYLNPRRISSLDLAVAWAALSGVVSIYRAVFPLVPQIPG